MKIAHFAIATPGRCGLYETARELVAAERAVGIDARIVDPKPHPKLSPGLIDRGVPIAPMEWAVTADLIVSHSGHDGTPVSKTDQPILVATHGRPISTWTLEREGEAPAYSYHVTRSRRDRYRAAITFWPEHVPYLRSLWNGKPVHCVPAMVDLDYWQPGPTEYDFAGQAGAVNVVMTDPWVRRDVSMLPMLHAFMLFRERVPQARLHIFAFDGNKRGLGAIKTVLGDGLGVVQAWAHDLRGVYRAADMLITPHRIWTRTLREAMASGCRAVSGRDAHPEDIEDFAHEMVRSIGLPSGTRDFAERHFDPGAAGEQMLALAEQYVCQEATT